MGRLFAEQRKLLFNTISGGAQRWLLEKRNGHSSQSPHNNFEILVSLSEDFFFLLLKKTRTIPRAFTHLSLLHSLHFPDSKDD